MTARVQVITPQQVEEKKPKEAHHNTLLLLSNSRNILWQTDSALDTFAAELNLPLQKLDAVLSRIDAEIGIEKSSACASSGKAGQDSPASGSHQRCPVLSSLAENRIYRSAR